MFTTEPVSNVMTSRREYPHMPACLLYLNNIYDSANAASFIHVDCLPLGKVGANEFFAAMCIKTHIKMQFCSGLMFSDFSQFLDDFFYCFEKTITVPASAIFPSEISLFSVNPRVCSLPRLSRTSSGEPSTSV